MHAENCPKFYRCALKVKVQMHTKSLVQKSNDLTDLCHITMDLGENGSKHMQWVCLYQYTDPWKDFKNTECICWLYFHIKSA